MIVAFTRLSENRFSVSIKKADTLNTRVFAAYRAAVRSAFCTWDRRLSLYVGVLTHLPDTVAAVRRAGFSAALPPDLSASVAAREAERAAGVDSPVPAPPGESLYAHQVTGVRFLRSRMLDGGRSSILADDMGVGKGQPEGSRILTPTGWLPIEKCFPGTPIIGSNGAVRRVTGLFFRGVLPVVRVSMNDGTSLVVDEDHLWAVRSPLQVKRGKAFRIKATRDLTPIEDVAGNRCFQIPMLSSPMLLPIRAQEIHPYVLGVLLGDGSLTSATPAFTPGDDRVPARVGQLLPPWLHLRRHESAERVPSFSIVSAGAPRDGNPLTRELKRLGLHGTVSETKFVPDDYLWASVEQRLELLRGLLDTDGELREHDGYVGFSSASAALASAVRFLTLSFGGVCRSAIKQEPKYFYKGEMLTGQPSYSLCLSFPPSIVPTAVWQDRYRPRIKYLPTRAIAGIEPAGHAPVYCLAVDAPDQLYVTEHFIVTHNTASTLMSLDEGQRTIVVCPKIAKHVWRRETLRWRPDLLPTVLETSRDFRWPRVGEVIIVNFPLLPKPEDVEDSFAPRLPAALYESIPSKIRLVGDEIHFVKEPNSQRTRAFRALSDAVREKAGVASLLSGTPLVNRPRELWAVLQTAGLGVEAFGDYETFRGLFAAAPNHPEDELGETASSPGAWGTPDPEVAQRLARVMLRRTKEDVLDLPPKRHEIITVDADLSDAALTTVLDIVNGGTDTIERWRSLRDLDGLPIEELSRCRAALALAKLPAALELLDQMDVETDGKEPIVVFSAHRLPIDTIAQRPGWAAITGDTSTAQRAQIENDFQAGKLRGIAATIAAAGTALTLTRAVTCLFVDQAWAPASNMQAEDRIYRIGQTRSVRIIILSTEHPIDRRVNQLLVEKRKLIAATVDAVAKVKRVDDA